VAARPRAWQLGAALAAALAAAPARAGSQDPAYAGLPAPAFEVYQALLEYADDGAFDRLGASMKHLAELFGVLEGCCAEPLRVRIGDAVSRHDAAQTRDRVLELIAVDFKRHIDAAATTQDNARATQELQMAAALYAILSPVVRHADGPRDARIRGELREMLRLKAPSELETRGHVIVAELGATVWLCPPKGAGR
jgi:hypothetical protein